MICEVRNNNTEVVLRNITLRDVWVMIKLLFNKNKEVIFTKPKEE